MNKNKDSRIGNNRLGIPLKYLRFLIKNHGERYIIMAGARRSGKSMSIHKYLWFLASIKQETIGIVCASYPALMNAIQDFQLATGLVVSGSQMLGYNCLLSNGSKFVFRAYDDYTKAQGTAFSHIFIEEVLNVKEDIVDVLLMSVTGSVYMAFNPTRKTDLLDKYMKKDKSNFLQTSYLDNPYLSAKQLEEFERMKARAMSPTATTMDIYKWKVYGLGEFADVGGKVFPFLYGCTEEEYASIEERSIKGMDFGIVPDGDATALVEIKIHENCLYAKELIYGNGEMNKDKPLAIRMSELGINEYEPIACDYASIGKQRIKALTTAGDYQWSEDGICNGFYCFNAVKGKVMDGLDKMTNFDKIYIVEGSNNLRREMENYEINGDGKEVSKHQNSVDALRYAVNSYFLMV